MVSGKPGEIDRFLADWAAAERDGDVGALRGMLANDFIGIGPLGFTASKAEWLDGHAGGALKYEDFRLDEVLVRRYGDIRWWPARPPPARSPATRYPASCARTTGGTRRPSGERDQLVVGRLGEREQVRYLSRPPARPSRWTRRATTSVRPSDWIMISQIKR
jgi:hypothetical protein